PAGQVFGADLSRWEARPDAFPPAGAVAVDPESGRLMLAADLAGRLGEGRLYVSYHYGTPDTLGAGGHPWQPLATGAPPQPLADAGCRTARPILRPAGAGRGRLSVRLEPGRPADPARGLPEPVPGGRLALEGRTLADVDLAVGPSVPPDSAAFLPAEVLLHQVTLVPPAAAAREPRLRVEGGPLRLRARRCVLGPVSVSRGDLAGAPAAL